MNKKFLTLISIVIVFGISLPVYGVETSLEESGNMKAFEDKIINIKSDYRFIESEVMGLEDSISENTLIPHINRKKEIKSKGNIRFEDGKFYFTAKDLEYLADEIDGLEDSYKCNLVDALNSIGTYFTKEGTITNDSSQNGTAPREVKTTISLGLIRQGIASSQSVENIKQTQAVDDENNLLFYAHEEAKNNNDILNITTTDTGYPLYYQEAENNNMTAGCAAWVNGILLKGNGKDNKIQWQNGYNKGYTQGVADSIDKGNIVYTYHQHTQKDGECYGKVTGIRPKKCGCSVYIFTDELPGYVGIPGCATCKHNHPTGVCEADSGYEKYTYTGLVCGKTEETIESATIIY